MSRRDILLFASVAFAAAVVAGVSLTPYAKDIEAAALLANAPLCVSDAAKAP